MSKEKTKIIDVTILSKGVSLVGQINTESDLLIEGEITGPVTSVGKVIVAKDGIVNGDITAEQVELYGKCEGFINAKGAVLISGGAFFKGNVYSETIEILKGADFTGLVSKSNQVSQAKLPSLESKILNINSLSKSATIQANSFNNSKGVQEALPEEKISQAYW